MLTCTTRATDIGVKLLEPVVTKRHTSIEILELELSLLEIERDCARAVDFPLCEKVLRRMTELRGQIGHLKRATAVTARLTKA